MNTTKKEIREGIFSFLKFLVIVTIAGILIHQLIVSPTKKENNVANLITLDNKPSDTIRDPKGQLHAQKEYINVPTLTLAEALYQKEIDSLRKELKLAKNDKISSMGVITTSSEHSFRPEVKRDSSTQHMTLSYTSKWADANLSSDTSKLSKIWTRDSLIFATVKQSYGFLKLKEKQYIDVKSANKDVKHIGVTYFEVDQVKNNKSKFGFGLGLGPGISIIPDPSGGHKAQTSWITLQAGIQYRF